LLYRIVKHPPRYPIPERQATALARTPALKIKYFLQLIALSAVWGASFMFLRIASPVLGPNVLTALRLGLASATLFFILRLARHRWPVAHWREVLVLALLSVALPFMLFSWSALYLPAGYSALLNSTALLFGTFTSAWMKEDTLTPRKLVGCLFGVLGVGLIVKLGPVEPSTTVVLAALGCITAAACFGTSTSFMKRALTRMQPLEIAVGVHSIAFLLMLPPAGWSLPQAQFTPGALAIVVWLGVVPSGLAYWAHLRIMAHVTPVAAMTPMFLVPLFGVTWGHLFLGEPLSSGTYIGGSLVLLASALVSGFNPVRRAAAPAQTPAKLPDVKP
jgi:drug/metabolite transporter (DMT)-like permease